MTLQEDKDRTDGCLYSVLLFLWVPFALTIQGLLVLRYWQWFLLPLGVPVVSLPEVMGLVGLLSFLTQSVTGQKEEGTGGALEKVGMYVFKSLAKVGLFWGLGAILHHIAVS